MTEQEKKHYFKHLDDIKDECSFGECWDSDKLKNLIGDKTDKLDFCIRKMESKLDEKGIKKRIFDESIGEKIIRKINRDNCKIIFSSIEENNEMIKCVIEYFTKKD